MSLARRKRGRAKRVCFSVGRAASDEEVYIVSMALMDDPFVHKVGDEIVIR